MEKISKRKLLSSVGTASLLGIVSTNQIAAENPRTEKWFDRTRISNAVTSKIIGRANSNSVFRETRKFIEQEKYNINYTDAIGYKVNRIDNKIYRD